MHAEEYYFIHMLSKTVLKSTDKLGNFKTVWMIRHPGIPGIYYYMTTPLL